ncbi:GerAB/ArcD/ProY family transporter [Xylanibacillus composti]|uniref:Germination protein n=1 Tax=Xylanibacillus composti TaxID=1572762 RepID=A0A8J4H785_9BACL|nr:endospore germination permease [Xylanibacillus composti]GIQ71080.1 germination protein [Xylanibacillus composti]
MTLTTRQAILWFAMHQLGSAFLVLPSTLVYIAKQDAWISVPIAIAVYLLIVLLYMPLANRLNGIAFHEHVTSILGKWLGSMSIIVFIAAFPFFIFTLVLRDLGDFITGVMMPETPPEAVYLLMLFAVFYVVHKGITSIGRTAEILFFLVLFLFVVLTVSLFPSVELEQILPVYENGFKPIMLASLSLIAFPYYEGVLFLFLSAHMQDVRKWKKAVVWSGLLSGGMFFVTLFMVIVVLGHEVVADLVYPSYFVVRTISIGIFYERFEVMVAVLWYITIFFRMSLLLYVSAYALAGVLRLKDYRSLLIPLVTLAFFMAPIGWPNRAAAMNSLKVWPIYGAIFGVLFPLAIWLAGSFRRNSYGKQ